MAKDHKVLHVVGYVCNMNKSYSQEYETMDAKDRKIKDHNGMATNHNGMAKGGQQP